MNALGRHPGPREDRVVRDVRRRIEPQTDAALHTRFNRYFAGRPLNPRQLTHDWNPTFELVRGSLRGGALLVQITRDAVVDAIDDFLGSARPPRR